MTQVHVRTSSQEDETQAQEDLAPAGTATKSDQTSTDEVLAEIDEVLGEAEARAAFRAKLRSISFIGTPTTKVCDLSRDCSTCSNSC